MLDILSRTLRTAAKTDFPHPPSATHSDLILEHEVHKANELRLRKTHERRLDDRW